MKSLLNDIKNCKICEAHLPLGPRPVVQASTSARILIVGQAPGIRVHETGIPFNDPSGDRLRDWMGIDRDIFYDETRIALVPMGFCYPGSAERGDLPPRKECADAWRKEEAAKKGRERGLGTPRRAGESLFSKDLDSQQEVY